MTIYKYPITITDLQIVLLPLNSTILTIQMQGNTLCLWAEVEETNTDTEERIIELIGTGHKMSNILRNYIGTVQQFGGGLIWHIYERVTL